jgi:periplasmic protein TonB
VPDPGEPPPEWRPVERDPALIKAILPHYPETARLAGIEGVVLVKLWVDTEGKVRQATVVRSTCEIFDEPALEAARQSVFRPAYMTGGAVSVWVTLPFKFRIRNAQ